MHVRGIQSRIVREQAVLAAIAISIGVVVGTALFVPFVALSYRRRGRLSPPRLMLWFAALVYFWAIWTYTLLPLPEPDSIRCVGMVTDPLEVLRDVRTAIAAPGSALTHPAMLQLVFNVLLFVPLGFFLRVLLGRGILTAFVIGFGLSLFVETTQLTGVWGLYPCAYRFFDVGDLMTNTTGALIGVVFGLVVPRAHRGLSKSADAMQPRPVTRGRRALAMICDGVGFFLVATTVAVGMQVYLGYVVGDRAAMIDGRLSELVGTGSAAALWLLVTLVTGQSIGDIAVQLRYRGGPVPEFFARLLRWTGGVAALTALGLIGGVMVPVSTLLLLVACGMFLITRNGRGLPGVLSGQQLTDARSPR